MKLLVLTDHAGHTATNSLYVLVQALSKDARITEIRVASRGTAANEEFFAAHRDIFYSEPLQRTLYAVAANQDLAFAPEDSEQAGFSESRLIDTPLYWPDAVLLRIPHPVPRTWFEFVRGAFPGKPIANDPAGIAATTSKKWLLNVTELCAPMQLCTQPSEVLAFAKTRDVVLKPLKGYAGKGILRIRSGEVEVPTEAGLRKVALDQWPAEPLAQQNYLAMEYLTRVGEGDKRIVVTNGRVLGAVLRVPAPGAWLCNVAQGGSVESTSLSSSERNILAVLAPKMAELGVVMYGVDTLMGNEGERVLSEINTMSIGGLLDLAPSEGRSAAAWAATDLLDYLSN